MVRAALFFWIFIASFFFYPSYSLRATLPTAEGMSMLIEKIGRPTDQNKLAFTRWAGSVDADFDGLDGVPITTIISSIQEHHKVITKGSPLPDLSTKACSRYMTDLCAAEPARCVRVHNKSRTPHFRISLPFSELSVPPSGAAKRACEYKRVCVDKRYLDRRIRDSQQLRELKKETASVDDLRAECKRHSTRISSLEQINADLRAKLAQQDREAKLAAGLRAAQG